MEKLDIEYHEKCMLIRYRIRTIHGLNYKIIIDYNFIEENFIRLILPGDFNYINIDNDSALGLLLSEIHKSCYQDKDMYNDCINMLKDHLLKLEETLNNMIDGFVNLSVPNKTAKNFN